MPELPEVETIRRGLERAIRTKRIAKAVVTKSKIIRGSAAAFQKTLVGNSFVRVQRHGKLLILPLARGDLALIIHLKMTGQLIYRGKRRTIAGGHQWPPVTAADLPNKYTHVQFTFADDSKLFFNDLRQFGFMEIVDSARLQRIRNAMGVDPITEELAWEPFWKAVQRRTASIKAVLLDQSLIAGVGNIYADEICFRAHVLPQRPASSLTEREAKKIFQSISRILVRAIEHGGTTFRDYMDVDGGRGNFTQRLYVYGRDGRRCRRCRKGVIQKTRVAQRGTHFCPECQV